jgi:hypothetical protein
LVLAEAEGWNLTQPSSPQARSRLATWLLSAGVILLIMGTGPLLAIIVAAQLGWLADPNPNPIGPGLLAAFTFWPSVVLIVAGLAIRTRRAPRV